MRVIFYIKKKLVWAVRRIGIVNLLLKRKGVEKLNFFGFIGVFFGWFLIFCCQYVFRDVVFSSSSFYLGGIRVLIINQGEVELGEKVYFVVGINFCVF